MKKILTILYWFVILGFVCTYMVSSTDDEIVIGGFLLILVSAGLTYKLYEKQIKHIKDKINEKNN